MFSFTAADAARAAGVASDVARPALARLEAKHQVFSPARGLYVCIPPEYRTWGAVPASWFVDPLMHHLDRRYYVGLLSAAELHGAAHQRPQAFQIVVDRTVRDRQFGRVRLRFLKGADISELPTLRMNVPTGVIVVSSPELTALDLANRPDDGGGLHNVATILMELVSAEKIDVGRLAPVASRFPRAAGRRLGWLLETFTGLEAADLAEAEAGGGGEPSALDPHAPRLGRVDRRWSLRLNASVEPDR